MILPLFLIPLTSLIFINVTNRVFRANSRFEDIVVFGSPLSGVLKLVTLLSLNINLAYSVFLWKEYPKIDYGFPYALLFPSTTWFELQHNLNLPFIVLSLAVMIVALLTSWYSEVNTHLLLNLYLVAEICLIGAFSTSNVFMFLLFFEASAIPVYILVVYCGSDRRQRLKASYYFLFFTLYGSISLLLVIINFYSLAQVDFSVAHAGVAQSQSMWVLLFVAFAVKIPLFPFHLWLPYAHVEANTSTSIILAALMLKLGWYGVLKFMLPMFSAGVHLFFRPAALFVCGLGVIYGSMVALRQVDLKRQIAFSSIAHMSFAMLGVFTFTQLGIKGAMYLMLSHGLTSAALFYLVGVLSDRYHTRSVLAYGGLMGSMPVFAFFLILASLANVGFPGTSGFIPELFVLVAIISASPLLLIPALAGMLLTTAGTLIVLLRLLFGHVKTGYVGVGYTDISKLDFIVVSFLHFWIIFLGMYDVLQDPCAFEVGQHLTLLSDWYL